MEFETIINEEKKQPYFKKMAKYINTRYMQTTVYPPRDKIFNSFKQCEYDDLKVVILGQDPYHEPNQAMGLSFSVPKGVKLPPSLINIYKELYDDLGIQMSSSGDLSCWAHQGVLLLNTVLTVERGKAFVHRDIGWLTFNDHIMAKLNDYPEPLVFILWGRPAQERGRLITDPRHLKIESSHPSPLSCYRGFFGSRPFSRTNDFLRKNGREEIDWRIKDEIQ